MNSATAVAEGTLVMPEPVGKQFEVLDSPKPRKVWRWGRRSGKTRGAFIAALLGHGPVQPNGDPLHRGVLQGGDVVWICPTFSNLSTVLWKEEIVPRMGHLPWITLNKQDHDVTIPGLGSLLLRSGDREAIDNVRGVGKRLFGVIIDEAAHMDSRGALLDVILPALLDNDGWLILMSTTNAGADGGYDDQGAPQIPSYFNQICEQIDSGQRPEWEHSYSTAHDNPLMSTRGIEELIAEYPPQSPKLEQEVYAKLLTTGVGLALPGLSEATHMVPAFSPPEHWNEWLAFDWGYHHPWALGRYTADEDGQVYKRDTLQGRLDLPEQIDAKVRAAGVNPARFTIYCGPDAWRTRVSKEKRTIVGEYEGPTVAEELQAMGWNLIPAADARVAGLNNIRRYTYIPPDRPDTRPRFLWMATAGNRACLQQMAKMPLDPKNPEDALKVNADHAGRGGDDFYDETRYSLMSRPLPSIAPKPQDREGQSMGYDYEKQQPRERETGDQALQRMIGTQQDGRSGRYRVPVRRG